MGERVLDELRDAVTSFDQDRAMEAAKRALQMGVDPLRAMEEGLARGIREVGERFERGEAFITHLAVAAEVMNAAMEVLQPELEKRQVKRRTLGTVVLGTVEGDIHSIGKDLVKTLLRANGFDVLDIGTDAPAKRFVDKAMEADADIVAASALMSTTMVKQRAVVLALREAGLRERVKVIVGGGPVTDRWAREIGADGYSKDAAGAVKLVKQIMGVKV